MWIVFETTMLVMWCVSSLAGERCMVPLSPGKVGSSSSKGEMESVCRVVVGHA